MVIPNYPFLRKTNPMRTSDHEPDPIPNYEVHCDRCKWWGYMSQLKLVYIATRDDNREPGCPSCLATSAWLEFKPNSLGEAVSNLVHTGKELKQAMENLHCQISQQQQS